MKTRTLSTAFLAAAALAACAAGFWPIVAHATSTPPKAEPPAAPAPSSTATSSSQAAAQAAAAAAAKAGASATGGTATSAVGDVAPQQTVGGQSMGGQSIGGDSVSSRAWSLFAQPPAFTPPMAPIAGCAPVITQEAASGWLIVGGASKASAKTDPTDCTLIALRNAKVDQCQYASAKQIEDLLTAKLLPGFKPSTVEFADLAPAACAALKAPPKPEPEVRYVTAFPPPAHEVGKLTDACRLGSEAAPTKPAKPKPAKKIAAALADDTCTKKRT